MILRKILRLTGNACYWLCGINETTRREKELISAGAEKSKLTEKHINFYSQACSLFYENNWRFRSEKEDVVWLINNGVQEDFVKVYLGAVVENKRNGFTTKFLPHLLKLLEANPDPEHFKLYLNLLRSQLKIKDCNEKFINFTEDFTLLVKLKPDEKQWKLFEKTAYNFLEQELNLNDEFTKSFTKLIAYKAPQDLFNLFESLVEYCPEFGRYFTDDCIKLCGELAESKPSLAILREFNKKFTNNYFKDEADLLKTLKIITVHAATSGLVRANSPKKIEKLQEIISNAVESDQAPYPVYLDGSHTKIHPDAQRVHDETLQVFRRIFNVHRGFSSLTFHTKRSPLKDPPLLVRFGKDVAKEVKYIHARDKDLFPGKGFLISGFLPEKIFVQDENAKLTGKDPFHWYKNAWPWANEVFNDLSKTNFIFTRGFIAISCEDEKYKLQDIGKKKINYSYVIFNDHFHNNNCDAAYLVPTEVLNKKLEGALIPYEDYPSLPKDIKDINEARLTPRGLIKEAKKIPANVLNIGWGSNIGGGLCNAYPLDSEPFYLWERNHRADPSKDLYGHIHKSYITGEYEDTMTKKQNKLEMPLRKAHDQIYFLTTRYQNLFDLCRLSLARWNKGETKGEDIEPLEKTDDYLFKKAEYKNTLLNEIEERTASDNSRNPKALKMLVEAYRFHKGREEGDNDKNNFPIFAVANALDYWSVPKSPFYLDTYDMTVILDGKKYKLPEYTDTFSKSLLDFWYSKIIPLTVNERNLQKDLRPYARKDLNFK